MGFIFRALKKLLIVVLVTVVLVGCVAVGGFFFIKGKYGIDVLKTMKELKVLSQSVDEAELCPNAFSDDDMVDVQAIVNESVEGFISYTVEHGYSVNFQDLPDKMTYFIQLTDKQVGALAQTVVKQEIGGKIAFGGKNVDVALKQVTFSEISENSVLLNTVMSADIKPFKSELPGGFLRKYIEKYIPDTLYVSSTVKVEKGAEAFSYTVIHDTLTVNNLNKADTEDLFRTLDKLLKLGEASAWNVNIGSAIANALIGNEANNGLAYSLQEIGATDYEFIEESGVGYFRVVR